MVAVNVVIWVILVFHIMCTILMKCNIFISVYFCKPSRPTETWPHWYSGVYLQHSGNNLTTLLLWDLATRPRLTLHIFCIFVITWVNSTASKNGSNIPSASYRKLCLKGEGGFVVQKEHVTPWQPGKQSSKSCGNCCISAQNTFLKIIINA